MQLAKLNPDMKCNAQSYRMIVLYNNNEYNVPFYYNVASVMGHYQEYSYAAITHTFLK